MQPLPPSRVLVPLGLSVCLSLFGDLTLYAVLVTQLDVVGLSLGAVGIMLGVNRLIRIPGNPLAGVLFDRWGRRRLFILGMLLGVLSTASYALVPGFWLFLVGRLAWGMAWTLINVGGMTMVLDVSTTANRGRLTGFYNTWLLIGLALGPLVGGFLVDAVGFRLALLSCAGITSIGLAIAVAALPETAPPADRHGERLRDRPSDIWRGAQTLLRQGHRALTTLAHPSPGLFTASWLFLITMFAGDGIILSTVSLLLQQRFGQSLTLGRLTLGVASAAGFLLAARYTLASIVGPLAGHFSDSRGGRWPVIAGSLVVGVVAFGLLSVAVSLGAIVTGVILGAVSGGAAVATIGAQVGDLTPPGRQGVVMGVLAMAGDIGSTAGPFLAFALLPVIGLEWVYLFCMLTLLTGVGLLWHGPKTLKVSENL